MYILVRVINIMFYYISTIVIITKGAQNCFGVEVAKGARVQRVQAIGTCYYNHPGAACGMARNHTITPPWCAEQGLMSKQKFLKIQNEP